ncbi:Uncharacterised protein [Mycobacteroides abscessus subsp. abscessus]|nr:Uncharacterised protein [Mycobacteroides abscessus subsp. abscessus]SIE87369.1 Uncharacterised protein [Mycobacteroides abscessus subsp. abscessus]SII36837.1 Uncharacterised protein [Mycobacteroides abscessus subsp. abscessus]
MVKPLLTRGSGLMQRTIDWMRMRGVKYWPAPFLPSLAAFSNNPSNAAAVMSVSMAVHSVSSIRPMSFCRLTGLVNRFCEPE